LSRQADEFLITGQPRRPDGSTFATRVIWASSERQIADNKNRIAARRPGRAAMIRCGWAVLPLLLAAAARAVDPPATVLSADAAVRIALEQNPALRVVRENRGLAAAGVVLARVYPFNPVASATVWGANGPAEAGVTNHVPNQATVLLDVEVRGQRRERRAAAAAAVTRTEWEIADQEVTTAVATIRAYATVLYRQQKLDILEETVRLDEQVLGAGEQLFKAGSIRSADLILARTELDAARALRGQGRAALTVARAELRRQLGTLDDTFAVAGDLDRPLPTAPADAVAQYAVQLRPDARARRAAVAEAEAKLRLQIKDRFGNPSIGPAYETNETLATFVGVAMSVPIPVFNTKQGEIATRRAELVKAQVDLQQTELRVAQDVQAALARFAAARRWADEYPTAVLPELRKAQQDMRKLFGAGEPGVDVLRVIGVQQNFLRAADAFLDAKFEVNQASADLAAAVGDPALALEPCLPK
jgi:cobalt-zinc-cadmium efflux system outer membrane protein